MPVLRTIPREAHGISRKQMSQSALRVLYRLREAGFGAFLVGGAVRDLLVGGAPKDFDVATDATPEQVKALFRNCRLIGRRFRLAHVVYGREIIEVATFRAASAQAANVLVFREDGTILADNTDGLGMLGALAEQAPGFDPAAGPVAVLGAGGAARGAVAAFVEAGCPQVRIVNRTVARAQEIASALGGAAYGLPQAAQALDGVVAVVNATSAGLSGSEGLDIPLAAAPAGAVVMDMVYKPLKTPFLAAAQASGRRTVDGLAMLIGQAVPSFEYFYGQAPPKTVDVRALAIEALGL